MIATLLIHLFINNDSDTDAMRVYEMLGAKQSLHYAHRCHRLIDTNIFQEEPAPFVFPPQSIPPFSLTRVEMSLHSFHGVVSRGLAAIIVPDHISN